MLRNNRMYTISVALEYGFSFHKVKEVSNYMIKTIIFLWFQRTVVGASALCASLLRTVYAFTVSALTEHHLYSCLPASPAPPLLSTSLVLPQSRTDYSASLKPLHRKFLTGMFTRAPFYLYWDLSPVVALPLSLKS